MTYLDRKRRVSIDQLLIDEINKQMSFLQDNASVSGISVVTGKNIVHYGI